MNKIIVLTVCCILGALSVSAQDNELTQKESQFRDSAEQQNQQEISSADNNVYDVVDQMPMFPGGSSGLNAYLAQNIKYPLVAEENGIQGRVLVSCVIDHDGSVTEVQVIKGVDPSLDKEAVRVVKAMPKWTPGTLNGNKVRVRYTVPVVFRLS